MASQRDGPTPSLGERMIDFAVTEAHEVTERERREAGVRPSGQELFDAMSEAEQDKVLGAAAAEKVRQGEARLEDFVEHTSPGETPGFIRQRSVEDL